MRVLKHIKGFSTSGEHLIYLHENGNLILDDEIIASQYDTPEKFMGHYFAFLDKAIGQQKIMDLDNNKTYVLPKGLCVVLQSTDTSIFYAYTYTFSPAENKTLYNHFLYNLEENKITRELAIEPDYAFIDQQNGYFLFGHWEEGCLKSLAMYKGDNVELIWKKSLWHPEHSPSEKDKTKYIGVCGEYAIFYSDFDGISGIDLETGEDTWNFKELISPNLTEEGKSMPYLDFRGIKIDPARGILYSFVSNIYWEWEVSSRQLICLYDHSTQARKIFYQYEVLDYFMFNEVIYYTIGGQFIESERRMIWPALITFNKLTGKVINVIDFKSDSGYDTEVEMFLDFQYAVGKFYLLDTSHRLWIIDK